jgi:hypothetical protein
MKKIVTILLITIPAFAFAEGLTLGGEVKTGVFWQKTDSSIQESEVKVNMHSQGDDAGNYEGRFRLNMDYVNDANTLGFRTRIQWEDWQNEKQIPEVWPYAFGYGNFFDNQLTIAIGKLGGSPWGTGGPEMWKELEAGRSGGVRFEFKPLIPEEYGKLNIGFVLNGPDSYTDAGLTRDPEIWDLLSESVIGVSYTHDLFMIRFAYRLDSELDMRLRGSEGKEGDDIVYRIEERALKNILPGLSIWALGFIQGVGASKPDFLEHKNWVFVQYAPGTFTAQIRFGFEGSADRSVIFARPNFYVKLLDGLIEAGGLFGFAQDFGNGKIFADSPFSYLEAEPKIQINFAPGAYAAFVYNWKLEYAYKIFPPYKQTQWMNLRLGIYF